MSNKKENILKKAINEFVTSSSEQDLSELAKEVERIKSERVEKDYNWGLEEYSQETVNIIASEKVSQALEIATKHNLTNIVRALTNQDDINRFEKYTDGTILDQVNRAIVDDRTTDKDKTTRRVLEINKKDLKIISEGLIAMGAKSLEEIFINDDLEAKWTEDFTESDISDALDKTKEQLQFESSDEVMPEYTDNIIGWETETGTKGVNDDSCETSSSYEEEYSSSSEINGYEHRGHRHRHQPRHEHRHQPSHEHRHQPRHEHRHQPRHEHGFSRQHRDTHIEHGNKPRREDWASRHMAPPHQEGPSR